MSTVDVSAYDWIFEGDLAWFSEGACVTVAVGATREQLAAAFGVDLENGPADVRRLQPDATSGEPAPLVGFTEIAGHQVAVEPNGFGGSEVEVLLPASEPGRAASAFWNADALARFGCARGGALLYTGEFVYDGTEGLPKDLVPYVELVADDLDDDLLAETPSAADQPLDISVALAMLEKYTGVRLTAADVTRALEQQYVRTDLTEQPDPH